MSKHKKCWANVFDDCSSKISGEHYISKSINETGKIKVWGLDWTGNEVIEIPIAGAVANILCAKHNTSLSELDTSIQNIRDACKGFYQAAAKYFQDDNQDIQEFIIDGIKFERWILKTVINGIAMSPKKYKDFKIHPYLIELAFGKIAFNYENKMGLYLMSPKSSNNRIHDNKGDILIRPLIVTVEGQPILMGSTITIFGLSFFLKTVLKTENLSIQIDNIVLNDDKFFHPGKIIIQNNNGELDEKIALKFNYSK